MTINIKEYTMQTMTDIDTSALNPRAKPSFPQQLLSQSIAQAWQIIAAHWPLQNFVAANPLQGLESLPFEAACDRAAELFQRSELPLPLASINRVTIKWCLAFFDQGQATFPMPNRHLGLYQSWLDLAIFDAQLHQHNSDKKSWLRTLSKNAETSIAACLEKLQVPEHSQEKFLTFMLSSLPGWAGHVKYRVEWSADHAQSYDFPIALNDYLAMRLIITTLIWPDAGSETGLANINARQSKQDNIWLSSMSSAEKNYATHLLNSLKSQALSINTTHKPRGPAAQLVFCIDVRSEPFRRALEKQGDYETFGFAGFFGVPVRIREYNSGKITASCPVLLSPQHTVVEIPKCTVEECQRNQTGEKVLSTIKHCYHGMKYTFSTHFALVEAIGFWAGLWMMLKTLKPTLAAKLKNSLSALARPPVSTSPHIQGWNGLPEDYDSINYEDQCSYAANALGMMGLTTHFAPVVILCGHGSSTQNNTYATALDCGACGGRHGGVNAQILAKILNSTRVRNHLRQQGIQIPSHTQFLAALHNTTTDTVEIDLSTPLTSDLMNIIQQLQKDLMKAQKINTQTRAEQFHHCENETVAVEHTHQRSVDWAQTRPEWGLARNATFIVGPRALTKNINLAGRAFLHSYQWEQDPEANFLTTILTAPMVVAQWINNQYLFSTIDNVAFGSGSKVTQNVCGKIGVMQGNASDLMHGLPLQSVYRSDIERYHEPMRLLAIVYAPREIISRVIKQESALQKLFGNGWVRLASIDPKEQKVYLLDRDLKWQETEG
jgi:uncharacterized protein YbcC (UPF0753/DUF2309 family)